MDSPFLYSSWSFSYWYGTPCQAFCFCNKQDTKALPLVFYFCLIITIEIYNQHWAHNLAHVVSSAVGPTFQALSFYKKRFIANKEIAKSRSEKWELRRERKSWKRFIPGMLFPSRALESMLASINRGWLFCSSERGMTGNSRLGQF